MCRGIVQAISDLLGHVEAIGGQLSKPFMLPDTTECERLGIMMVMSTRMGTFDIKNASYVLSMIHAIHAQLPHPRKPTPPTTSQARIPRPTTPFQPNQAFKPTNTASRMSHQK